MQVKIIAECSPWSILQYFWPPLSYHLPWRPFFLSIFEWPLKTGFTVFYSFSGSTCEEMATIPIDPCSSDPCLHGGTCVNVTDGYHCQCTENFLGDRCEATIRYCIHNNPCKNGAVCEDHPEGQLGHIFQFEVSSGSLGQSLQFWSCLRVTGVKVYILKFLHGQWGQSLHFAITLRSLGSKFTFWYYSKLGHWGQVCTWSSLQVSGFKLYFSEVFLLSMGSKLTFWSYLKVIGVKVTLRSVGSKFCSLKFPQGHWG